MKKIFLSTVAMGMLTMSVYGYDQTERIQDMRTMETAMAEIQKGILYNHKKMTLQGILNLKAASSKVEVAPKNSMDYSVVYAKQQAEKIIKFADKIKSEIEVGHKHAASTNYAKVLNECVSCHNKIRKWN